MVRPSSRPRADASSLIALLVGLLALAQAVGFLLGYLGAALLGLLHA